MTTEYRRQQQLRGDSANWGSNDIILLIGEFGIEMQTPPRLKVGDGVNPWSLLPYIGETDFTARADILTLQSSMFTLDGRVTTLEGDTADLGALTLQVETNTTAIAGKQDLIPPAPEVGGFPVWNGSAYQPSQTTPLGGALVYWDATLLDYVAVAPGSTGQALVWDATGKPVWATNPAAGVPEAPIDTQIYARQSSAWVVLPPSQSTKIINDSGSTRLLALTDSGAHIRCSAANNVTVPPNSSVNFAIGAEIKFEKAGTGDITLTPGSGVTINVKAGFLAGVDIQYGVITLVKVATDVWTAYGDLAT